ncbi:hypothetical protein AB0M86_06455 [Streptomyces sp. NPDC051639]|nr:hypothetical protein [Streptomyces sp. RPA4-2]
MSELMSPPGGKPAEELNWSATGGLFDDVVALILRHVRDESG